MSQRAERADGLHEQRTVVKLARTGVKLAADHLVVHALVARDADFVDGELLAFEYLDLDVDRIRPDDGFGGFDLRHQVALVLVERRYGHRFGIGLLADAQTLVHRLLVVRVALVDAEHALQVVGFVHRVADPRHVADVVFVAFRNVEVDGQPLVADRIDRVADDRGVAVAFRVVEVDQQVLVVLVVALVEFGAAEEVDALLVRLLEGPAQALVLELLVAREVDLADLDFVFAVDQEGYVDHLRAQRVVGDARRDLRVAEALLGPVGLDEFLVLVDDVIRKLAAAFELELFEQVFLLALRDAFEVPVVDARPLFEEHLQIEAVALDLGSDLHVREKPLAPQTRDGVCDEVARQVNRIAGDQPGRRLENVGVEVLHAVNVDVADVIEFLRAVLPQYGCVFRECGLGRSRGVSRILLLGEYIRAAQHEGSGCREYLTEIIHLFKSNLNFIYFTSPKRRSRRAYSSIARSNSSSVKSGHSTSGK